MASNDQEEVIVDDLENNNEEEGGAEGKSTKVDKPKRTPQEEYDYHRGRADRLGKKLGLEAKSEKTETVKNTPTDKPSEFSDGQLAILRADGIKRKDEIALVQEYVDTGKKLLDVLENKHFLNDLKDLRETRESTDAVPKGKGRTAQTGTTDLDLAVAKFNETGELPEDFTLRTQVVNKLAEREKDKGLFTGRYAS